MEPSSVIPAKPSAIEVRNISKVFQLPHERHSGIKQSFVRLFNTDRGFELQRVLEDVSFEVKKGEFFGIVGRNGSGKSTLLKILAGIYTYSGGSVRINGSLTPFIELGVGFNPELTGRENVFLNGALLGFSRSQMAKVYDKIVDFAELEKYMDQKLKNYSSGMQVRLAFSIAIQAKSDILLIDEVLAVGDAAFQTKCFDYFHRLKKEKATVILVSHDQSSLERFCDRGILIDDGKIISSGKIKQVLRDYTQVVLGQIESEQVEDAPGEPSVVTAKGRATISQVRSTDPSGAAKRKFAFGDPVKVSFVISVKSKLSNAIAGVTIWEKNLEKPVFATNTFIEQDLSLAQLEAGDTVELTVMLPTGLNNGTYIIEPAVANESATVYYDRQPGAATFVVSGSNNPYSILAPEKSISVRVNKKNG